MILLNTRANIKCEELFLLLPNLDVLDRQLTRSLLEVGENCGFLYAIFATSGADSQRSQMIKERLGG